MSPKLGFCYFLKVASLYFLDIAQNCSLGRYLKPSRAEISKKNVANVGAEMIFSILISLSVHSNLSLTFYVINYINVSTDYMWTNFSFHVARQNKTRISSLEQNRYLI